MDGSTNVVGIFIFISILILFHSAAISLRAKNLSVPRILPNTDFSHQPDRFNRTRRLFCSLILLVSFRFIFIFIFVYHFRYSKQKNEQK